MTERKSEHIKKTVQRYYPASKHDKILYLQQQKLLSHNGRFFILVELARRIDEDRLKRAVRLTMDAEPVLGCHFIYNWRRPYWERRNDLDDLELCNILETRHMENKLHEYLVESSAYDKADLHPRVHIFRAETDTLCITLNHMHADAIGGKDYTYLLADIYNNLEKNPDYIPQYNTNGDRSLRQVKEGGNFIDNIIIAHRCFRSWISDRFPRSGWSFPVVRGEDSDIAYIKHRFPPEQFAAIKEYKKQKGVTINDILVAAYLRALYEIIEPDPGTTLRIATPINLRRHIRSGKTGAICNMLSLYQLKFVETPGSDYEETLSIVHRKYKKIKDKYFGLGEYHYVFMNWDIIPFSWALFLCAQFGKMNRKINYGNVAPILSNLGFFEQEKMEFDGVSPRYATFANPLFEPPFFMTSASTFGEYLTIHSFVRGATQNRPLVERLYKIIEREISS